MTPKQTVLIVEDDAGIREAMEGLFGFRGFKVFTASHGGEAIDLLKKGAQPQLIFFDLRMPNMSGPEFVEELRKNAQWSTIPLAVLSGDNWVMEQAKKLGIKEVIRKPVDADVLFEVANRYCSAGPNF